MKSSVVGTPIISVRGRKLAESLASRRLLAMLRSTLQSWPKMMLSTQKGEFGASSEGGTYLYVSYSSDLTAEQKRDLLALFATWLIADPDGLLPESTTQSGSSLTGTEG